MGRSLSGAWKGHPPYVRQDRGLPAQDMIRIPKDFFEKVLGHLKEVYPNEGCGLLSGRRGEVLKIFPMRNVEVSPVSFLMDSREELSVFRKMREENLELLGIYHSHPTSEAYPSEKDRALAFDGDVFYVIASLKDPENPLTRAFWIKGGKIEEDKIQLAE